MSIQKSYVPNLTSKEVFNFIVDPQNVNLNSINYKEPPPFRDHYDIVGKPRQIDTVGMSLIYAIHEFYSLHEGQNPPAVVGSYDVILPVKQQVNIGIFAYLLIDSQSSISSQDRQVLENAFGDYNLIKYGKLSDYLESILNANPNIKDEMFMVDFSFELALPDGPRVYTDARDAMQKFWEGKAKGTIQPDPNEPATELGGDSQHNYICSRKFKTILIDREYLQTVPERQNNPYEIEQGSRSPEGIIKEKASNEWESLKCSSLNIRDEMHKILTLLEYPEFKVEWLPRRVVLMRDCGVEVAAIFILPILFIRQTQMNLWINLRSSKDTLDKVALKIVERCLWEAALAGAVVGAALGNLPLAVGAFKSAFSQCVKAKIGQFVECLLPQLLVLKEPGGWKEV